jgi:uncharacterized protein
MIHNLIYFGIALTTCSLGSFLGIGGGIIIVPTLLSLGITKELATGSSSWTVLVMSSIASYVYFKRKQGDIRTALLFGIGCIPGSYLGVFFNRQVSSRLFNILFGFLILLLLLLMLLKNKMPKLNLGNAAKIFFGMFIGVLAGFFGIGGGPITVPILLVVFGLQQKIVSATSSYITLITAFTSVLSNVATGNHDLSLVLFMIPGAILGAQVGTFFNKKASEKTMNAIFILLLIYLVVRQFT